METVDLREYISNKVFHSFIYLTPVSTINGTLIRLHVHTCVCVCVCVYIYIYNIPETYQK